jgi:serine/threonine protein phosphatase PrpC
MLPEMSISPRHPLVPGDLMLVCTDGFWANLEETLIGSAFASADKPLRDTIAALSAQALLNAGPLSDNTSVAALRFLE